MLQNVCCYKASTEAIDTLTSMQRHYRFVDHTQMGRRQAHCETFHRLGFHREKQPVVNKGDTWSISVNDTKSPHNNAWNYVRILGVAKKECIRLTSFVGCVAALLCAVEIKI